MYDDLSRKKYVTLVVWERNESVARRVSSKKAVEEEVEDLEVEDEETEDLEVEDEEEPDEEEESGEEEDDEVEGFDELEVEEETDEDEEEEEAPKPRSKKKPAAKKPATKKSAPPEFGTKQLIEHVNKVTGKALDGRGMRIVLRRLASEGVIQRTVGDDRGRYSFTGPNDPQVKAVVAAIKAGVSSSSEKKAKPVAKKPVAKKAKATSPKGKTTRKKAKSAASE